MPMHADDGWLVEMEQRYASEWRVTIRAEFSVPVTAMDDPSDEELLELALSAARHYKVCEADRVDFVDAEAER